MPAKSPSIVLGAAVYLAANLVLHLIGRQLEAEITMGIVMMVAGCLVMLAIGAFPVWHYTRRHRLTVPVGTGAGLGAAAIVLGALVMALVTWGMVLAGWLPDPQLVAADQADELGFSEAEAQMMIRFAHPLLTGLIGMVIAAIAGSVGGAIGAAIFKGAPGETIDEYDR